MDERVATFRLRGSEATEARQAPVARKIAPARTAAAAPAQKTVRQLKQTSASGGGPVRRMQAELADAVNADDWKEF
jgi:methyl-accepting chemotaxis protein